jgi:hypothetical protein
LVGLCPLHQIARQGSALPPDVRRGSASPDAWSKELGFAHGAGSAQTLFRTGRPQQNPFRAEPAPGAKPNSYSMHAARQCHASHPAAKPIDDAQLNDANRARTGGEAQFLSPCIRRGRATPYIRRRSRSMTRNLMKRTGPTKC